MLIRLTEPAASFTSVNRGFHARMRGASSRLGRAVAAALAVGAMSVALAVAITLVAVRASQAMPL